MPDNIDKIYAKKAATVAPFTFDAEVSQVFTDMIARSVPGYKLMLELLGVVCESSARANTNCYDLGCSVGASSMVMLDNIPYDSCKIIALDASEHMIAHCQQNIVNHQRHNQISIVQEDIQQSTLTNASIVCLNLILQFIKPQYKTAIIQKAADALLPGGVLFLSEKVSDQNQLQSQLHQQFKKHNGYSDLEIQQKRSAIAQVLHLESIEQHLDRLDKAGLSSASVALHCLGFATIIAYK